MAVTRFINGCDVRHFHAAGRTPVDSESENRENSGRGGLSAASLRIRG